MVTMALSRVVFEIFDSNIRRHWHSGDISALSWLSQVAWCDAWLSSIHGPARHRGSPQLQLSHTGTAAHPTLLTPDEAKMLAHSIVTSRLD